MISNITKMGQFNDEIIKKLMILVESIPNIKIRDVIEKIFENNI